jgi:hypothetical protein
MATRGTDGFHLGSGCRLVLVDRTPRVDRLVHRLAEMIGEPIEHHVEQIAGPATVQCAHGNRLADPEAHELPHLGLAALVVGLVGDHDHLGAERRIQLAIC